MGDKSRAGWLDEFWTVVLVMPYVCAFLPWTQHLVSTGFGILSHAVPVWYQAGMAVAIAWGFGRKTLINLGWSRR